MNQAERETRRRKRILEHARTTRNVVKTCRYFGVSRSTFYLWRRRYQAQGDAGLPRAYAPELYKLKCSAVFEHVYESYPERDAGVYAESA